MRHKHDKLIIYILGYVYALLMVLLTAEIIYGKVPFPTLLIVSISAYSIVNLILSSRKTRLVSAILLVLSGIAVGILFLTDHAGFIFKQWDAVMQVCFNVYYNIQSNTPELLSASLLLIILASVAASIAVYLFFNRFFNFFLITAGLISMQVFSWLVTGRESRLVIAGICFLIVAAYFRLIYENKLKSGAMTDRKVSGGVMLYTIPAAVIPIIIIMSMPRNEMPIQVPWLTNRIMPVIQSIEDRFTRINVDFFSLSSVGFNGSSELLGGPISPSNITVMDVKSDRKTYLRGASFSRYENNSWMPGSERDNVNQSVENDSNIQETIQGWQWIPVDAMFPGANTDDAELLRNLASPSLSPILFPKCALEVTYRNMTTRTMFTPLLTAMPVRTVSGSPYPATEKPEGIMVAEKKFETGSKYQLDFFQPMYGDPMFKQALTFSSRDLYKNAMDELTNERTAIMNSDPLFGIFYMSALKVEEGVGSNGEKLEQMKLYAEQYERTVESYENFRKLDKGIEALGKLSQRAENIRKEYTALSGGIPGRVRELSLSITKDCKNDYEKLLAIQKYLAANCSYTLNASRVPPGNDFVDWFLFEDPNGYCTYFATAMTVMLRENDIPARFVEGYVMPGEPKAGSVYTISNRFAHSWVEAYFEGFGWLTFEATPIYSGMLEYSTGIQANAPVGVEGEGRAYYESMLEKYKHRSDIPGYTPAADTEVKKPAPQGKSGVGSILFILPGLLLLLALVNLLADAVSGLLNIRLTVKRQIIRYFLLMLGRLEASGYPVKPGETVFEFAERIEKTFYFINDCFIESAGIFAKIRYGGKDAVPEELLVVKRAYRQLNACLLKKLGLKRLIPLRRLFFGI